MEGNMNSIVSVIIPTYNSAQFIKETVESALNQTYKPLEVIVADDGSTDNTQDILKPYMPRINYIYKENGGPASARNLGIKSAKGEFIAFLDSDDIWLPTKLKKQIDVFKEDKLIGLIHCQSRGFKNNVNEILIKKRRPSSNRVSGDMFASLFWANSIGNSSVMVKTGCFQEIGLFDEDKDFISVEDYDMWLRISKKYKFGYVDETLVGYRIHGNGISRQTDAFYSRQKKVIEKTIRDCPEIEKLTGITAESRFAKLYLEYGLDLLQGEQLRKARKVFLISLKYNPLNLRGIGNYLKCRLPFRLFKMLKWLKRELICR